MKTFYSTIILILFSFCCKGQTIEWGRACGGNYNDYFYGVATDSMGFIYIVGSTASFNNGDLPADCYSFNPNLPESPWVFKCDSLGNLIWSKCLGINGKIYDIVGTDHNSFYITGSFCDASTPGCDLWFAEMDTAGTLGTLNFVSGGPNFDEYGFGVGASSLNRLIAVGMTNNPLCHGNFDFYFISADTAGAYENWYGGSDYDSGNFIHELSNGNILMVGTTFSNDGDITSTHGNGDAWVVEIGQWGNIVWQKTYGGSEWDIANSFIELPNGSIAIAGTTHSSDGDISFNHSSDFDAWLFIIDSVGNLLNSWTYGGSLTENFYRVFFDSSSNLLTAIGTASSLDGDVLYNHNPLGGGEFWMLTMDSSGSILSSSIYGGTGFELVNSATSINNDIIIIGSTNTDNDGDVSNYHFSAVYPDDGWVVRIENVLTKANSFPKEDLIKFFPNPATDKIKLSITYTQKQQRINVRISDLLGNVVISQRELSASGEMDVSGLSAGCYLISVNLNSQSYIFKLIKL